MMAPITVTYPNHSPLAPPWVIDARDHWLQAWPDVLERMNARSEPSIHAVH